VLAKLRFLRSDNDLGYLLRVLRNTSPRSRPVRGAPMLALEEVREIDLRGELQPDAALERREL
jgi:hypothetical protein